MSSVEGVDEPCGRMKAHALARNFFDEDCVVENCLAEEIDPFMSFLLDELSFDSLSMNLVSLMMLFVLLQLGGIPFFYGGDDKTYNSIGLAAWILWMECPHIH